MSLTYKGKVQLRKDGQEFCICWTFHIFWVSPLPRYNAHAILSPCGCENSCTIPAMHEFLQPQDDSISCSSADTYNIEWNVPTIQNSWPSFLSWTFPFEKNFNIT